MKESAPAAERSRGSDSIGHGSRRAHPDQLRAMRTALRGWLAPLHSAPGTENGLVLATNEAASNAIERACPAGLDGNGATGGDNRVDITLRTESGIVRIGDQRLRDLAGAAAQPHRRGLGITSYAPTRRLGSDPQGRAEPPGVPAPPDRFGMSFSGH
jgi:anti-sigma factor RsiW